jgi:hypothetical protein
LRPYNSWKDTALSQDEDQAGGRVPRLVAPLTGLTTPLAGAFAARRSTNVTRNNDQFNLLARATDPADPDWDCAAPPPAAVLDHVVFKADLNVSLNWTLPRSEVQQITDAVNAVFDGPTRPGLDRNEWLYLRGVFAAYRPGAAAQAATGGMKDK